jgi:hypothetical protein
MLKKNAKIIISFFVIILILGLGVFGFITKYYNKQKIDPFQPPEQTFEEDVKPETFVDDKAKVTIYVPNEKFDGYIKKEVELTGVGTEIQKQIIDDVLFDKINKSGKIKLPDSTKIISLKVWDETLQVNFSKDILNAKVDDPKAEKFIIGSVVNSLLTSSNAFTDVQFFVEGERIDRLFGHFNTKNPLMHVQ